MNKLDLAMASVEDRPMDPNKVECPRCEGTGDYCYQGEDGYGKWGACHRCKGTGEINA